MNKQLFKKTGDELQGFLMFKKRGKRWEDKKKYNRKKAKRNLDKIEKL